VDEKRIVGIVEVVREAYPDPTAEDPRWMCPDVKAVAPLARPVTLAEIKADPRLAELALIKQSRLSVMPSTVLDILARWGVNSVILCALADLPKHGAKDRSPDRRQDRAVFLVAKAHGHRHRSLSPCRAPLKWNPASSRPLKTEIRARCMAPFDTRPAYVVWAPQGRALTAVPLFRVEWYAGSDPATRLQCCCNTRNLSFVSSRS
jgi:hypothetical protein